ncbi:MAG: GntR family transcriptional regulator [Solirubrobacteraceae bacterium]
MVLTEAPNLGDAAHTRIRRAIVRLELPPGAAISEQQLVDAYGLTKASVRSALARLRSDGLVASAPRRGHVVTQVTLRDVREVYDLRVAIEPMGAERAAGHLPAATLRRLRALTADPPDLGRAASVDRFLTANRELHVGVAAAAGSGRLLRIVSQLVDDSERVILLAIRAGAAHHGRRVHEEHRALLTALAAGDGAESRRVMEAAVGGFRDELVAVFLRSAPMLDVSLQG